MKQNILHKNTKINVLNFTRKLKKKLTKKIFKDTCFCPQKKIKLISNVREMTPRKPNSARRKIFWAKFNNIFKSKAFVYLSGEHHKALYPKRGQGLQINNVVLARNGLTKDLRGVRYKIIHGAVVRKYKFFGMPFRKTSRSKYGCRLTKSEKWERKQWRSHMKRGDNRVFRLKNLSNKLYE